MWCDLHAGGGWGSALHFRVGLAASRQVAAYVRGTQLIWGFGLRPGVSFEADSASF
jgi:hypothetical protein